VPVALRVAEGAEEPHVVSKRPSTFSEVSQDSVSQRLEPEG
jgi:hypothetical protein